MPKPLSFCAKANPSAKLLLFFEQTRLAADFPPFGVDFVRLSERGAATMHYYICVREMENADSESPFEILLRRFAIMRRFCALSQNRTWGLSV